MSDDGSSTCAPDLSQIEKGEGASLSRGNIRFEGTLAAVEVDYCPVDSIGVYEVRRLEDGNLQFAKVEEDECIERVEFFAGASLVKIEFRPVP